MTFEIVSITDYYDANKMKHLLNIEKYYNAISIFEYEIKIIQNVKRYFVKINTIEGLKEFYAIAFANAEWENEIVINFDQMIIEIIDDYRE